ncbi:MAG: hypothetical protein AAF481_06505 [Acidobacteriota bacterium]
MKSKRWSKKRKILSAIVAVVLLLLAVPCAVMGPYVLRVQRFEAEPELGYHAPFFVYASPGSRRAAEAGEPVTMLVQPNNSGIPSDDAEVHSKDAWWTAFGRHGLADELEVVLLVPAFVRPWEDWQIYTHALDRDVLTTERRDLARVDLQLLAMVEQARKSLAAEGIRVEERFLLQGYSASGMFANRFAVLHPRRVKAVAAGSPGGWPIAPLARWQDESLPYPIGIADLEELTGAPFDTEAYAEVPQLLVMGSLDDNDSVDFRDGWDEEPAATVDRLFGATPLDRWDDAEKVYRQAGAQARFLLVDGVDHDRRALQEHSTRFFAEILGH